MISVKKVGVALALVGFAVIHTAESAPARRFRERANDEPVRADWNAKRFAFDVRGKSWDHVLRWFAQQAQMPIITKGGSAPPGQASFYNVLKDGKPREWSLNEILDLLNEMLIAEHRFVLLRGESALVLFPVDEDIPNELIRRVTLKDLGSPARPRTEVVEITIKLNGDLDAEELAPKAKRLLGVCGRATPVGEGNQLILVGTGGSLLRHLYVPRGRDVGIAP